MAALPDRALPDWATAMPVQRVLDALEAAGGEGRFVGGCVRDTLAGRPIQDVDIATPLLPDAVIAALQAAGLGAVPTGIEHGTITALVEHQPYEVTTLRQDVETFGRHAVVAFTEDWRTDALRRDLTMNALYLDRRGRLYDFFAGAADLAAGRVRFVGDPWQRIREDYLRILRFLRFHAHYGRGPLDAHGMAAAAALAAGLDGISGERKRQEFLRLLEAPDPLPVLEVMLAHGILRYVLPRADGLQRLRRLLALAPDADALQRLAVLLPHGADPTPAAAGLRLSNRETGRLKTMASASEELESARVRRRLLYRLGAEALIDRGRLAAVDGCLAATDLAALEAEAAAWRPLSFPLRGRDLVSLGIAPGRGMGDLLKTLEEWWIEEGFRPDRAALLAEARRRLSA